MLLGIAYYSISYLLLGAMFLGIGAQASTVREVQTLSMPVTMVQVMIFCLASAAVGSIRIAAMRMGGLDLPLSARRWR